jgi:hypothetical protein
MEKKADKMAEKINTRKPYIMISKEILILFKKMARISHADRDPYNPIVLNPVPLSKNRRNI